MIVANHPYHLYQNNPIVFGGCNLQCDACWDLYKDLTGNLGKNVKIKLSDDGLSRIVTGKLALGEHFSVGGEDVMFFAIREVDFLN